MLVDNVRLVSNAPPPPEPEPEPEPEPVPEPVPEPGPVPEPEPEFEHQIVEVIYTPDTVNQGNNVNIEFYESDKLTKIAGPFTLFTTSRGVSGNIVKKFRLPSTVGYNEKIAVLLIGADTDGSRCKRLEIKFNGISHIYDTLDDTSSSSFAGTANDNTVGNIDSNSSDPKFRWYTDIYNEPEPVPEPVPAPAPVPAPEPEPASSMPLTLTASHTFGIYGWFYMDTRIKTNAYVYDKNNNAQRIKR